MNDKTVRTKMKIREGKERNKDFNLFISTYTEEELKKECERCLNCPKPSCKEGCPIHNRIPEFIAKALEGDLKSAYEIINDNSLMPDICGTICPHEKQCEGHCIRNKIDEPVSIGAIERYIGEWAIDNYSLIKKEKNEDNGKKIACIGGGAASMACAEVMALAGYKVTIYEENDYLGGVLAWGIPSFRLNKNNVKAHIDRLKDLDVEFIFNKHIDNLEELKKEYDAIFLGLGAYEANIMNIEGEDLEGIYKANEFLKAINLSVLDDDGINSFEACGKNVIVCGGGNVAMDASRAAIRLPQVERVTIVYRRSENEMPATKEEIAHAKEEGIEILTLCTPIKFIGDRGKVKYAECAIMELGEEDESGRRSPIETDKPHLMLEADTVILALGYKAKDDNKEILAGLEVDRKGNFIVDEEGRCSVKGIYAGGDAVSGATTVVNAMKAGILAAQTMKKDLA